MLSATTSDRSDPNGKQRRKRREAVDARLLRMILMRSSVRGQINGGKIYLVRTSK